MALADLREPTLGEGNYAFKQRPLQPNLHSGIGIEEKR
jgi:hypothetical protein